MGQNYMSKLRRTRHIDVMGVKHKVTHPRIKDGNNGYYYQGNIEVNGDIKDQEEYLKVLIHEALHGVFSSVGISEDLNLPQEHTIINSTITFLFTNFDVNLKKK